MRNKSMFCALIGALAMLLLSSGHAFAFRTSYVYFEVIDGKTGKICKEVIVNTTTQEAKYSRGKPYTTERVDDCIQYKVMGCGKVKESSSCYPVKNVWSQTVTVYLR